MLEGDHAGSAHFQALTPLSSLGSTDLLETSSMNPWWDRYQSPLQLNVPAILSEGTFVDNGNSNFEGDPHSLWDDATIYVGEGVTLNSNTVLPIQREPDGDPLLGTENALTPIEDAIVLGPSADVHNFHSILYGQWQPLRVEQPIKAQIPAYQDLLNETFSTTVLDYERSFDVGQAPLNTAADWDRFFPPAGTAEHPTVVFITGGGLKIPDGVDLKNIVLLVDRGDVNFNGSHHHLENVTIVAKTGNVNLNQIDATNLKLFAEGSICLNQEAWFTGENLLAAGHDVRFNHPSTTGNDDVLKVVVQDDIVFNAKASVRGVFLAGDEVIFNGESRLVGSIQAKEDIIFNAPVNVIYEAIETLSPKSKASQPLIGILDTGISSNPDIDPARLILLHDYIDGDDDPRLAPGQGDEHGTHVTGMIAATRDNGIGIDGVNVNAPLAISRVTGSGKWADALVEFVDRFLASDQPNAIAFLGFDLTQVNPDRSITTRYELTLEERSALEYARQNKVLIVVPAGNEGSVMSVLGQASQEFDNIITVGSSDGLSRAGYSNYGQGVDILAPGGTVANPIVSTVGDAMGTMSGTSIAAAQAAGQISNVWAVNPELNYRQVIEIVKATAQDVNVLGWDRQTGAGLLNIKNAIQLAEQVKGEVYDPPAVLLPASWSGEGNVQTSERPVSFNYPIHLETFTGRVGPSIGVNLRISPDFDDRGPLNEPQGKMITFDAWTYGEVGTDIWLNTPDALWFRVRGTDYWVPSAYINGYPGSHPAVLPSNPSTDSETGNPGTVMGPAPVIPMDSNSAFYRDGRTNPFAYRWQGQCTWYAYGRMLETELLPAGAKQNGLFLGNAEAWRRDASRAGLALTADPILGMRGLVVFPPGVQGGHRLYGHVAFVEEVFSDGSVRISESNWAGQGISERILTAPQYNGLVFIPLENAAVSPQLSSPSARPGEQREYRVRAGDTLSAIAARELGNADRWREITKTDGSSFTEEEARRLQIGQSVYLPVSYQSAPLPVPVPITQPIPSPQIEQPKDGWGYVTKPGETWQVGLKRVDGSMADVSDRTTWVVIHGMNSSPDAPNISSLASTLGNYDKSGDQVFTLDWSVVASSGYDIVVRNPITGAEVGREPAPDPRRGGSWITKVADFASKKLEEWKIAADKINVVGHSLGSYVAYEIAKYFTDKHQGEISRLVALDPATTTNWGYERENSVNFSNYSKWAWGFYGSQLGHDKRAQTAEESFQFDFGGNIFDASKHHGAVVEAFTEMLERNENNQAGNISRLFDLTQMANSSGKPWQRHDGFEAILRTHEEGDEWPPDSLTYYAGMNDDTWLNPWDERWNTLTEI